MSSNKQIICLNNLIEDSKVILSRDIDVLQKKAEKEELLHVVSESIRKIETEHKKLSNLNKKKNNNYKKKAEKAQLREIKESYYELKQLFEEKSQQVDEWKDEERARNYTISNRETNLTMFRNRDTDMRPTSQTRLGTSLRNMYDKETKHFQGGVKTAQNTLKMVKDINVTLDDVADLVRLQKYKLLSIQTQIGESQSIMRRSQKIMKSFSKELHQDKIIKVLLGLITVVLILIMISAITFKMKSGELIGKEIKSQEELQDFTDIDETLFWKTVVEEVEPQVANIVTDEELKKKAVMVSGGIDLMKLDKMRKQSGIYKEMEMKKKNNRLI